MTTTDRTALIIFAGVLLCRLGWHLVTGFFADDAFITYRYAENLAAGLGFVYNEGERVLGTTTPLFTFLLACCRLLHLPVIEMSLAISLVASGLTGLLLYRYAQFFRFGDFDWLPSLLFALWPRSLAAETCGMESSLFTLLVLASFYSFRRSLDFYAIGAATVATLTRPEGLLLLGIVGSALAIRRPARIGWYLLMAMIPLLPWGIFSFVYFGSPLPNSVGGKLALYELFRPSALANLSELLGLHQPVGIVMTLLALAGALLIWKRMCFGIPEALWLIAMTSFYSLLAPLLFFWYFAPFAPFMLLAASAPIVWLVTTRPTLAILRPFVAPSAVTAAAIGLYPSIMYYADYQQALESMHKQVGIHLRLHAQSGQLVAAEDIGYMGYYSKARILDRDGLVSPEVHPYNRRGAYGELIADYKPDWVVVAADGPYGTFVQETSFQEAYRPDTTFRHRELSYSVYQKR